MSEFFEMLMMLAFGSAWPTSILKSIKAKTTKGKSLLFLVIVFIGYLFGIASKIIGQSISYVLVFYCLNALMVGIDIIIYFRNLKGQAEERRLFR